MGKRFSLSSQGSPHLVVPVVSECEELWIGLAGAERSVEMGRERSSGVFGGSAFLVHPRASGTWNLDSDVSSADAPPVVSERPPAEAQDTPEVSLAPSEESGSDTGDEAEPSSPDEVQPKAGPDPDAPQALDGESFPVSASQPSEPIDDENAKESAPLAASVVTPMGETLLQVPTSRVPEGWLAPDSDLVDGIQCPNGHLNRPDVPQGHHCRWCGRRATEGTRRLVKDRRPALGQLKEVSTSKEWPLTRSVVLGRAPSELLDLFGPGGEYPQPSEPATMVIADEHDNISRAHALIRLDGWQVFVRDLGSLNQTRVRFADGRVISLDPGTEYPVEGRCTGARHRDSGCRGQIPLPFHRGGPVRNSPRRTCGSDVGSYGTPPLAPCASALHGESTRLRNADHSCLSRPQRLPRLRCGVWRSPVAGVRLGTADGWKLPNGVRLRVEPDENPVTPCCMPSH